MADQERKQEDGKPCPCDHCLANNQRQNKRKKQGPCKGGSDCQDQTCASEVAKNKEHAGKKDEREEQHKQHAQAQAKGARSESKDPQKQAKTDSRQREADEQPADASPASVASPGRPGPGEPALRNGHATREPLGGQQPHEPEQRAEPDVKRGEQRLKHPEKEETEASAKKALQSQPESNPPTGEPAGPSGPKDEGARGATDAKAASGTKRPAESAGVENGGKSSKQPKQDEQPKEERQSGQRQPGEQQLESQPSSGYPATQPNQCTSCCPIHCASSRQGSTLGNPEPEPDRATSEREISPRRDGRNRNQRRRSTRTRRRSPPHSRPRARNANRRRRPSTQGNPRRRR